MPKSARNQSKPWTPSDVAELQAFVDEEMTVEEIADELGRTAEAVRAKAAKEDISFHSAGNPDDIDDD
jgi:predicted transcriptional regulator